MLGFWLGGVCTRSITPTPPTPVDDRVGGPTPEFADLPLSTHRTILAKDIDRDDIELMILLTTWLNTQD